MKAFYTILLLIVSNIFMTFAWYGHLKLQEMKVISNWPLYAVILSTGRFTPSSFSRGPLPWPSIPSRCPPTASASLRTAAPSR